jgi:hypothetical protein
MASNITTSSSGTSFDFLVGYDNRRTLEGIIPVTFNYAVSLTLERPVEILGKVVPVDSDEGILLEGVNFHQSASQD